MNFLTRPKPAPSGGTATLAYDVKGREVSVLVRRRRGLKRMTLRICPKEGVPYISAPPSARDRDILSFLDRHIDWIADQLSAQPGAIEVVTGALIPLRGEKARLVVTNRPPRTVFTTEDEIVIGGPADLAATRLEAFLKAEARKDLRRHVDAFSAMLDVSPRSVSIRDTVSRWGSCSSRGTLNFSWRLILAPPSVLAYVAAHEVSHLREMNHSSRFWQLVASIDPDWGEAKAWLKKEGPALMKVRFTV